MALGEFTKQIAQQAILSATTKEPAAPQVPSPENVAAVFLGQIHAMQKALKDDEELLIQVQNGPERMRVLEVYAPSAQVLVLSGVDGEGKRTRLISAVGTVQLSVRVVKAQAGKALRVGLVTAKTS